MKLNAALWRNYWDILAILVLAIGLRAIVVFVPRIIDTDGVFYARMAESFAHGDGLYPDGNYLIWSPFYSLAIAPVYSLLGDSELAGRIVSLLASTVAVVLAGWVGSYGFGKTVGRFAALLVATCPALIVNSSSVMTEMTYSAFLMLAALLAFKLYRRFGYGLAMVLGASLGALYLTRPEGLFATVGIVAIFLACAFVLQQYRHAKSAVTVSVVFLAIALTYIFQIHALTGAWELSTKTHNNWYVGQAMSGVYGSETEKEYEIVQYGLNSAGDRLGTSRFGPPKILQFAIETPRKFQEKYIRNLHEEIDILWEKLGDKTILTVAAIIGLIGSIAHPKTRIQILLAIAFLAPMIVYPIFYIQKRTIVALLPIIFVFVARGIEFVAIGLNRLRHLKLKSQPQWFNLGNVLIALLLVLVLQPNLDDVKDSWSEFAQEPLEQKVAGLYLKQKLPADTIVMSRKPWVAYYAAAEALYTPYADRRDIFRYAYERDADVLVVDERQIPELRPQLAFLLDTSNPPPYLETVYSADNIQGGKIAIYAIDKHQLGKMLLLD
jgi:4-amino-4-deoxy-L-arabinose transferase-like glycosyltransferase